MIQAVIFKNSNGEIQGFKIKGHAGFDRPGRDIVCSAVSAVVYAALGGLDELAGFRNFTEKDGLIICYVPENLSAGQLETTDIILKTMVVGLRQIEAGYDKYIRIRYEEV
ncbi:MAG: ribosomal-processing cysteine protease Prp [Clostridiaceae bacterium]|jgi:uncharacterized protein YsxB (DUF464 family)|nr:ribosomal-processing cysteine protease Prp [Clostridiaceae bacterium]